MSFEKMNVLLIGKDCWIEIVRVLHSMKDCFYLRATCKDLNQWIEFRLIWKRWKLYLMLPQLPWPNSFQDCFKLSQLCKKMDNFAYNIKELEKRRPDYYRNTRNTYLKSNISEIIMFDKKTNQRLINFECCPYDILIITEYHVFVCKYESKEVVVIDEKGINNTFDLDLDIDSFWKSRSSDIAICFQSYNTSNNIGMGFTFESKSPTEYNIRKIILKNVYGRVIYLDYYVILYEYQDLYTLCDLSNRVLREFKTTRTICKTIRLKDKLVSFSIENDSGSYMIKLPSDGNDKLIETHLEPSPSFISLNNFVFGHCLFALEKRKKKYYEMVCINLFTGEKRNVPETKKKWSQIVKDKNGRKKDFSFARGEGGFYFGNLFFSFQ